MLDIITGAWAGRIIAALVLAIGLYGCDMLRLEKARQEGKAQGVTETIEKLNTEAEEITHGAVKAREAARKPGAADRLRKSSCRDCD